MSLFSKFRSRAVTPLFIRNLSRPNEGMIPDPTAELEEFAAEPHAKHLGPVVAVMSVAIVGVSIYFWYNEINHLFIHRHRPRFPKMDFVNQGVNPWPWSADHKHSPLHHEYFNFTPQGYETDKHGNRLPPGVYAEE